MQEERAPNKNLLKLIGAGMTLAFLHWLIVPSPAADAVVIAAITKEVTERQQGEGGCIRQGAIHEALHNKSMDCASGTRDVPATALSYPLARTE